MQGWDLKIIVRYIQIDELSQEDNLYLTYYTNIYHNLQIIKEQNYIHKLPKQILLKSN